MTPVQTLTAPFRKSALFSTPISECLDEIEPPPDSWDSCVSHYITSSADDNKVIHWRWWLAALVTWCGIGETSQVRLKHINHGIFMYKLLLDCWMTARKIHMHQHHHQSCWNSFMFMTHSQVSDVLGTFPITSQEWPFIVCGSTVCNSAQHSPKALLWCSVHIALVNHD